MAKRGKSSQVKGKAFERKVAKLLTDSTGVEWKRGLGQSREGGEETPDVYSDQHPNLHFECKKQKVCRIKAAMKQALGDTKGTDKTPIVVTQDDYQDILVTMLWDDWVELFTSWLDQES